MPLIFSCGTESQNRRTEIVSATQQAALGDDPRIGAADGPTPERQPQSLQFGVVNPSQPGDFLVSIRVEHGKILSIFSPYGLFVKIIKFEFGTAGVIYYVYVYDKEMKQIDGDVHIIEGRQAGGDTLCTVDDPTLESEEGKPLTDVICGDNSYDGTPPHHFVLSIFGRIPS